METITEKSSKAVKKLIVINNDRYEGYKTAAKETKDADLIALFNSYSQQSKQFGDELQHLLPDYSYSPDPGETKTSGKLYRVFMDIKVALQGKDRKGILASCEFGEDAADSTYDDVLENPEGIDDEIFKVILKQQMELEKSHDKIKNLRDNA